MTRLLLLLPIGILAISTASVLIKLCDAPALVIAAYRMGLASLMLLPFAAHPKVWQNWKETKLNRCMLSGCFLGLHFALWIGSLKFTSVASSVVLVATHPIFVGLGAWVFLSERPNSKLVSGTLLSVAGCGLISYGDLNLSTKALLGDGLALLGAIAISGYLLIGRKLRKDKPLLSYIFPVYATAAVCLILLVLIFRKSFLGYSSSTYLLFLLLALIPQLVGHTTFNWALKYLPASMVAIAILGEPVGSTVLAYLILGEGLTAWKVGGGILIFTGIIVALRGCITLK